VNSFDTSSRGPALTDPTSKWHTVPIPLIAHADFTDAAATEPGEEEPTPAPVAARRFPFRSILGVAAALVAVATVVIHIVGISVATAGDWEAGTTLGYVANAASILGILLGAIATVLGLGRAWGIAAIVVSVFANPFLLVQLFAFIEGR
jgi:hypothetical protein